MEINNTSGETQGYKSLFHSLPATLVFRRPPRALNMQSLRSAVSSRRKLLAQSAVTGLKSTRDDVEVGWGRRRGRMVGWEEGEGVTFPDI